MSEQIDTEKNEEFWNDLKEKPKPSESELSDLLCDFLRSNDND